SWFKAVWARPVISPAIICVVAICCLWFWFIPPLPGVAVTVLGATAAIMTFREMHNTHRVLAALAISALMGIERRDIRIDRDKSDAAQVAARALSEVNFKTIGDGIKSAITQSQNQFSTTVPHVDRVSGLAEENLKNMTGGDSWGWVSIRRYDGP